MLLMTWFAVGSIGGPIFGKLSSVASNNQASYLPANADSTKVQALAPRFMNTSTIPAVVLVTSNHTLTQTELSTYATLGQKLRPVSGVAQSSDGVVGPIPSQDHKAVEYIVQVASSAKVKDVIDRLRTVVFAHIPAGATGYVTGPAGVAADLIKAFSGIDGLLLYVTLIAVFVILLLVYRSIILPFVVLMTAMFALSGAGFIVYHGVLWNWFKLNGQSQGILSILVIGAATDYSLLLISRFREALTYHESRVSAMLAALKGCVEPIIASGSTVIIGLLCLLFSDLNSNKSLGPVAAVGIVFALFSALTFLPAMLVLLGRVAFWPFRPRVVDHATRPELVSGVEDQKGLWRHIPHFVSKHARLVWIVCLLALGLAVLNVPSFKASGTSQSAAILGKSNAVAGQTALGRHFSAGSGNPVIVIADTSDTAAVVRTMQQTAHLGTVTPVHAATLAKPLVVQGQTMVIATLDIQSDSTQAQSVIRTLRSSLAKVDKGALVGGQTALSLDSITTSTNDLHKIIPIVLVVILIILMLLLRSVVAPLLLIGSVILSFSATIGISALVFNHLFHFPGSDPAIPLFGFIFLVALGVDYNIFLMTRVREESKKYHTKLGIVRGLSVTGSVITSAGVVLAATFAALGVVPVLFLAQIAFIVSFGVLLDTIIVRTLLVPAVCYDIGKSIWWPFKLL